MRTVPKAFYIRFRGVLSVNEGFDEVVSSVMSDMDHSFDSFSGPIVYLPSPSRQCEA